MTLLLNRKWPGRVITAVAALLCLATAAGLLYSAYCQYTWMRMQLNDYGMYTNFLWNSAHGHPFRFCVDQTYLRFHLSFSLLLFAPLFLVWDHPFLLTLVHWLCGIAGALFIWRIGTRHRLAPALTAAFMFLFLAYPFAQRVLLCEFHGVCMYFVLLPWLYYCLRWKKGLVWLPLVLLCGLREDAAFVAVPILIYFAVADRWKAGYVYAGLAALYGILAINVLFPALSGMTIVERRGRLLSLGRILASWLHGSHLSCRGRALFWLLLPAVLLLRRGWIPIVTFPSVALLTLLASPLHYQHAMQRHYSAPVFALLVLGMIEAAARPPKLRPRLPPSLFELWRTRRRGERPAPAAPRPARQLLVASFIMAVTLVASELKGDLPWSLGSPPFYRRPLDRGWAALAAAAHLPKEGVLLSIPNLLGYCANRADVTIWKKVRDRPEIIDLVFFSVNDLRYLPKVPLREMLTNGTFGVLYFDSDFAIMKRGADTGRNQDVLRTEADYKRTIRFAATAAEAGEDVYVPGAGLVRHWNGDGSGAPVTVAYGSTVHLGPGRYTARFLLSADQPKREVRKSWGRLGLYISGQNSPLVEAEVEHVASAPGELRTQELRFALDREADVESKVTAADAELWLQRVVFVPEGTGRDRNRLSR